MGKQNSYIFSFSIFLLKISALVILIGLVLNYTFENLIIFKGQTNGASKINKIISKTEESEIPIFGSSRAESSFVTSIIDKENCFNYGISGAQSNVWLFFLDQELKKEKNTPIIINFDLIGLVSSDGEIGNYIPNWNVTEDMLIGKGEFYYNVPFIKYYGQYERYLKSYISDKTNLTKYTDKGGSFEKNKLTKEKFQKLISKRLNTKTRFGLDEKLLHQFNKLINSTRRTIILVISPYHKSYFNKFENIEAVDKYLSEMNSKENIEVIDLRSYIDEDALFYNTSHLNYEGAIKFTNELKEQLSIKTRSVTSGTSKLH